MVSFEQYTFDDIEKNNICVLDKYIKTIITNTYKHSTIKTNNLLDREAFFEDLDFTHQMNCLQKNRQYKSKYFYR